MIVLGVDPGTRHLGWGVVELAGQKVRHLAHGVLDPDPELPLAGRLVILADGLVEVLERHRPTVGAVESLFFHKDAQAAAKLGHARGVVLLCLARAGLAVHEYAPAQVKRTVAGNGRADKAQVARMVGVMLGVGEALRPDASDALAVALTHARASPLLAALGRPGRGAPRGAPRGSLPGLLGGRTPRRAP